MTTMADESGEDTAGSGRIQFPETVPVFAWKYGGKPHKLRQESRLHINIQIVDPVI
jgi:hypothetical protein